MSEPGEYYPLDHTSQDWTDDDTIAQTSPPVVFDSKTNIKSSIDEQIRNLISIDYSYDVIKVNIPFHLHSN